MQRMEEGLSIWGSKIIHLGALCVFDLRPLLTVSFRVWQELPSSDAIQLRKTSPRQGEERL